MAILTVRSASRSPRGPYRFTHLYACGCDIENERPHQVFGARNGFSYSWPGGAEADGSVGFSKRSLPRCRNFAGCEFTSGFIFPGHPSTLLNLVVTSRQRMPPSSASPVQEPLELAEFLLGPTRPRAMYFPRRRSSR